MKSSNSKNIQTLKNFTVKIKVEQLKQVKGGSGGMGVIDIIDG